MDKLNKDELFLIAIKLDLPDLLNFCSTCKRIESKEIWYYKLKKEFPDYEKIIWYKSIRDIYETLYFIKTFLQPKIKGDVYEIYSMKKINLSFEKLKELPKEIGNLTNLQILFLNYNYLKEIPKEIGNLSNLQGLYLQSNKLKDLQIGNLFKLQRLCLDANKLKEIPKEFDNLSKLEIFNLHDGQLKEIPKNRQTF
jgi:hypothetical protein